MNNNEQPEMHKDYSESLKGCLMWSLTIVAGLIVAALTTIFGK